MTANQAFRSKVAVGIALLTLSSGVLAGATLTGAGAADRVKPPRSCITAIHDYQKVRSDILKMLKEEGDGYSQLVETAFKAGLADTNALAADVLAKEKAILATVKSEAPTLETLERQAVAAADKCEKGRGR